MNVIFEQGGESDSDYENSESDYDENENLPRRSTRSQAAPRAPTTSSITRQLQNLNIARPNLQSRSNSPVTPPRIATRTSTATIPTMPSRRSNTIASKASRGTRSREKQYSNNVFTPTCSQLGTFTYLIESVNQLDALSKIWTQWLQAEKEEERLQQRYLKKIEAQKADYEEAIGTILDTVQTNREETDQEIIQYIGNYYHCALDDPNKDDTVRDLIDSVSNRPRVMKTMQYLFPNLAKRNQRLEVDETFLNSMDFR